MHIPDLPIDTSRLDFGGLSPAMTQAIEMSGGTLSDDDVSNTTLLLDRIAQHPDFWSPRIPDRRAPFGYFRGRHIIGSRSRVSGGVYLGAGAREALVVDVDSDTLLRTYCQRLVDEVFKPKTVLGFIQYYLDMGHARDEEPIADTLHLIMRFVQTHLPFDDAGVIAIMREHGVFRQPDKEVSLDVFLRAHAGVCRHQVCFLAALVEDLKTAQFLDGVVRVERRRFMGNLSHAWVRYTTADGTNFILDPAQNIFREYSTLDTGLRFLYRADL